MFSADVIISQGSFSDKILFVNASFLPSGGLLLQGLVAGIACMLLIWILVVLGNVMADIREYRKGTGKENKEGVSLGEVIKNECRTLKYKKIHLDIFTNGIHNIANRISLYWRESRNEYIIVLRTNLGYLVETANDSSEADKEFSYICSEDEAENNGIDTSVNFFDCTLYDLKMEKEINHKGSSVKCIA